MGSAYKLDGSVAADLEIIVRLHVECWVLQKKFCSCSSVTQAAAEMGVEVDDLKSYLRKNVKKSFSSWCDALRIEESESIILSSQELRESDLARRLGYKSADSFCKSFENIHGMKPAQWRSVHDSFDTVRVALARFTEKALYRKPGMNLFSIARELGVSIDNLRTYCHYELKDTIENHIEKLRVEDAMLFLSSSPYITIPSLANALGFSSPRFLMDAFLRQKGMTIEEWMYLIAPNITSATSKATSSITNSSARQVIDDEPINEWIKSKGYCRPDITQKGLARELGYSYARFSQYLSSVVGLSFSTWISGMRVAEAKTLLIMYPSFSLSRISWKVGYAGKAGFCAAFKEHVGQSPEGWRRSVLSGKIEVPEVLPIISKLIPNHVKKLIDDWVEEKGFCLVGLSIKSSAASIGITENQLTAYCLRYAQSSYPVWIIKLKISEASSLLVNNPMVEVSDIAKQVGYGDVKVFRSHFKNVNGELPTEWRKHHKWWDAKTKLETPSQDGNNRLDITRLHQIESSTSDAHEMLSDIFVEEDIPQTENKSFRDDIIIKKILSRILEKKCWTKASFETLCSDYSLLPGFVIECINDIAFETVGDLLIYEEDDILNVELDYKEQLL